MYFNAANTTNNGTSHAKIERELNEKAEKVTTWAYTSLADKSLGELLEGSSYPREFKTLVENHKEVASIIAEQGNRLLAQIDYDKLLEALETRGKQEDSTPQRLWGYLCQDYGPLRDVRFAIASIEDSSSPNCERLWQINNAVITFSQLRHLAKDYLLDDEQQKIKAESITEINPAELKSNIVNLNELIEAERTYQDIAHNMDSDKRPRWSAVLTSAQYSNIWTQNPYLTDAINARFVAKQEEIQALGVHEEDMQPVEDRESKVAYIRDMSLLAPVLERVYPGEEHGTVIRALAAHNILLEELPNNDYLVNRITRDTAQLPHDKGIAQIKEHLATSYPDMTVEEAQAFLNDKNHSLGVYCMFSHQATHVQKSAAWSSSLKPEFISWYTDADWINRARALRYSLDHTPHNIPEVNIAGKPLELPPFQMVVDGPEYSYLDFEKLRASLNFTAGLGGLPIATLSKGIIFDQAMFDADNDEAQEKIPEVYQVAEADWEVYQFSFLRRINHAIAHETGELLVARMNYRQIETYVKIFENEQMGEQAFVSDYSHTRYTKFPILGIKEDLCDAIAAFATDFDTHLSLLKSSPDRYRYVVALLASIRGEEDKRRFLEGIAITMYLSKLDNTAGLKPTEVWKDDSKTVTSGEVFKSRERVKKMVGIETEKESMHIYIPGLEIG